MISILVTSRIEGNVNHRLKTLLDSLKVSINHPDQIEVLVKYDNDDYACQKEALEIVNAKYPFRILCEDGPRGRGYIDIHLGYNQLLHSIHPDTNVVVAMADDFTCNGGWDDQVHNAIKDAGEYFIVHSRPHPRKVWQSGTPGVVISGADHFNMDNDMFESEDLHIMDESPMWSLALLRAAGSFPFPVSFTDAWTVCLEYVLWHDHQIDITKFLPGLIINRYTNEIDQQGGARWAGDRKTNFDYIQSSAFRRIVMNQAEEIACRLSAQVK